MKFSSRSYTSHNAHISQLRSVVAYLLSPTVWNLFTILYQRLMAEGEIQPQGGELDRK